MSYFQRQHHVIRRRLVYRSGTVTPPTPVVVVPVDAGADYFITQERKSQVRRYVYPYWEDAAEEEAQKIAAAAPIIPGEIAPGVMAEPEPATAEAPATIGDDPQSIADEQAANEAAEALIAAVRATIAAHSAPPPMAEAPVAVSQITMPDDLFFAPIITDDTALVMEAIALIEIIELQECY